MDFPSITEHLRPAVGALQQMGTEHDWLNFGFVMQTVSHHLRRTKGHDEDWFIILEVICESCDEDIAGGVELAATQWYCRWC